MPHALYTYSKDSEWIIKVGETISQIPPVQFSLSRIQFLSTSHALESLNFHFYSNLNFVYNLIGKYLNVGLFYYNFNNDFMWK